MWNEPPPHMKQLVIGDGAVTGTHALESGLRPEAVEAEQEAFLECGSAHDFPRGRAVERLSETHAEVGLLEHVQQARHRPAARDLAFEGGEVHWLRLRCERRENNAALSLVDESDVGILRDGRVQLLERDDMDRLSRATNASAPGGCFNAV